MNTHSGAEKVSTFCRRHAGTIKSMNSDNVALTSGTWHNALLHLGRLSAEEAIWEAMHSGPFTGTDINPLFCGSILFTPTEQVENPCSSTQAGYGRKEVEDAGKPLTESYVGSHMASMPSICNKHHRRHRQRRTASSLHPPPTLTHEPINFYPLGSWIKEHIFRGSGHIRIHTDLGGVFMALRRLRMSRFGDAET